MEFLPCSVTVPDSVWGLPAAGSSEAITPGLSPVQPQRACEGAWPGAALAPAPSGGAGGERSRLPGQRDTPAVSAQQPQHEFRDEMTLLHPGLDF